MMSVGSRPCPSRISLQGGPVALSTPANDCRRLLTPVNVALLATQNA